MNEQKFRMLDNEERKELFLKTFKPAFKVTSLEIFLQELSSKGYDWSIHNHKAGIRCSIRATGEHYVGLSANSCVEAIEIALLKMKGVIYQ